MQKARCLEVATADKRLIVLLLHPTQAPQRLFTGTLAGKAWLCMQEINEISGG